MYRRFFFVLLWLLIQICIAISLKAQDIRIALGPDQIGENETWTITITAVNESLREHSAFPNIKGFRKGGSSSQSQTSIVNGQMTSSQSIVMRYIPAKQGTFTLYPFEMLVNGKKMTSEGKKIRVTAPVQRKSRDPFGSFFDNDPSDGFFGKRETEFVEIKEDAFFALTTNKKEVYVGEGFTTTLSFIVAESNRAPMDFFELPQQLSNILKKIKPSSCWEENFSLENIEGEPITIKNKRYTQYKIYQASFYPLTKEDVFFPSVSLKMVKYKVAKRPSFFGQNRKQDFKVFRTAPKRIKVNPLPPHPLRESVAIGNFRLHETIDENQLNTEQSTVYNFGIYGEGNISAIEKPTIINHDHFDIYDPNINQHIQRDNGHVVGNKTFSYYLIPKEPGTYELGDFFKWIFFNPNTGQYDTLQSKQTVVVSGNSRKNKVISNVDIGSFYDRINKANNTPMTMTDPGTKQLVINLFILLSLGITLFIIFRK